MYKKKCTNANTQGPLKFMTKAGIPKAQVYSSEAHLLCSLCSSWRKRGPPEGGLEQLTGVWNPTFLCVDYRIPLLPDFHISVFETRPRQILHFARCRVMYSHLPSYFHALVSGERQIMLKRRAQAFHWIHGCEKARNESFLLKPPRWVKQLWEASAHKAAAWLLGTARRALHRVNELKTFWAESQYQPNGKSASTHAASFLHYWTN